MKKRSRQLTCPLRFFFCKLLILFINNLDYIRPTIITGWWTKRATLSNQGSSSRDEGWVHTKKKRQILQLASESRWVR